MRWFYVMVAGVCLITAMVELHVLFSQKKGNAPMPETPGGCVSFDEACNVRGIDDSCEATEEQTKILLKCMDLSLFSNKKTNGNNAV